MARSQPEGFLATPSHEPARGVLVLHAWWGLNDTIKAVCKRLAEAGYTAFAPDLYHGKVADTIPGAEALSQVVDANHEQTEAEVVEAARFLHERAGGRGMTVMGFSLGAYYSIVLAAMHPDLIDSVALFYGTVGTMPVDQSRSQASYLGHFAANDPFETPANVDTLESSLKQAGRPVSFYRYPGTSHWFFEPDRTDAYNKAAASLAWERTLEFLKSTSGKAAG